MYVKNAYWNTFSIANDSLKLRSLISWLIDTFSMVFSHEELTTGGKQDHGGILTRIASSASVNTLKNVSTNTFKNVSENTLKNMSRKYIQNT